jgi:hypothetical protein
LKWLVGIPLAIVVIFYGIFWYWELRPRYITFDMPTQTDTGSTLYWGGEEYGTLTSEHYFDYFQGRRWIWRRIGQCFWQYFCWDNQEEAIAFFDNWLYEKGWEQFRPEGSWNRHCFWATLLNGYTAYEYLPDVTLAIYSKSDNWYGDEHVCIVLYENGGVVFATVKDSPMQMERRRWAN